MYAIYGNMDPINIPPMLAYIPYMDPMGRGFSIAMFAIGFSAQDHPKFNCHVWLPKCIGNLLSDGAS